MEEWRSRLGRAGQGLMQFLQVMTAAPAEVQAWPSRWQVEVLMPAEAAAPAEATTPAEAAAPTVPAHPAAPPAA